MAIIQISQIQIRRGLQQDLPQLASGEMGWSIDTRRLYIGNGTESEGAPEIGRTEILTQHSNFLNTIPNYTFAGTDSGYTSQTGPNLLNPVNRTLQSVLDDIVTVRDFGALGDGATDDTAAINRAIQQIFVSSLNGVYPNVQRSIKFPAGKYLISTPILIPPNFVMIGDGKNNTIIQRTNGTVLQTADSLYQTGGAIGNNGATLPSSIYIAGISVTNLGSTDPVVLVNNATDMIFDRVRFTGGDYSARINGVSADIQFLNSTFTGFATGATDVANTVTGLVSRSNYFDAIRQALTAGTATVATVGTGSGVIEYELRDSGTNYRIGRIKYTNTGSAVSFENEYTEPASGLGATMTINNSGVFSCTVSGTSYLKYNIKQFV